MFKNFNQTVARSEIKNLCDNRDQAKSNCNSADEALFSGEHKNGKLSIDDESSHPINGSSTNNKSERKRNINMLLDDEDKIVVCSVGGSDCDDDCDEAGVGGGGGVVDSKRMKVDGQDNNKSKMYQVSTYIRPWHRSRGRILILFFSSLCYFPHHLEIRFFFCCSSPSTFNRDGGEVS